MIVFRTILFYGALVVAIRLMGKRQIGQMEPSEFVVTMLIANLAAIPLEDTDIPILHGLLPMAIVMAAERISSWVCLKNIRIRRFLCGKPVILIENGRLLEPNLKRTRINLDELSGHLREKGVLDIAAVQYAILETNGAVTVFPFPRNVPATAADAGITASDQLLPYTLITDGHLLEENLGLLGKSGQWLSGVLSAHGCTAAQVLLLTADRKGHVTLIRRESAASDSGNP